MWRPRALPAFSGSQSLPVPASQLWMGPHPLLLCNGIITRLGAGTKSFHFVPHGATCTTPAKQADSASRGASHQGIRAVTSPKSQRASSCHPGHLAAGEDLEN